MKKLHIGILFGGRSGEHEVSLMSARSVLEAIDREKYEIAMIGITKDGHWICGDDALFALESGAESVRKVPAAALLGDPTKQSLLQLFLLVIIVHL